MSLIGRNRLIQTSLQLARVDSPSRGEAQLAQLVQDELAKLGSEVRRDTTGNVIASLPGDRQREPVLFASHMDVVMPCHAVQAQIEHGVITSGGDTVLGADAQASVAALLELAAVLQNRTGYPPIELVFTWGEEVGHLGAKALDVSALQAKRGWVMDGLVPVGTIIVAAPTYYSFVARVHGRAAHAGVEPERGISAIAVAAQAISRLQLGRLDASTTADVGTSRGGSVRDAVPAEVEIESEVRSLSAERAHTVAVHIESTLTEAARGAGAERDVELVREQLELLTRWVLQLVELV